MTFAFALTDRSVVDAGEAAAHESILVKLPVFVAIGAEPVPAVVMPLISKTHRHPVLTEAPQLLDESIVQLVLPFAGEEGDDRLAALDEFGTIAPIAIDGVGDRDLLGIAAVPSILCKADLSAAVSSVKGGNGGR